MRAKHFALGFGIAVILPMVIHFGVSTFSPRPERKDYRVENYRQRHRKAGPEEKAKLEAEKSRLDEEYKAHQERFSKRLFLVSAPIGIAAIIVGSFLAFQAIGAGLMFGGIFCLINGYSWYWSELEDWMRFVSLLATFVILIIVGYRKLAQRDKK